jgi:transposase InsO family protein
MAWNRVDVQEQRVRFVMAASRGEKTFRSLCQEFKVSRPTGYLWLQRYREQGLAGVAERSRRPQRSPRQTGEEWEQRVVELRQRYPDWGARKLQVLLARAGRSMPASTIHRILLRRGLVRLQDRHAAAVGRFERAQPNQLWQMDFKGSREWQTHVGPLSVLDDHSRYLIALRGTWTTQAEAVREHLESAFSECGVPEAMLMDHGTPWWNARAPTGATWLTVWLMRQGIELHWSGYRHPQTQGKVERFHGSLQRAQGRRGVPEQERQPWLDAYRDEYNQVRPHEALACGRQPACGEKVSAAMIHTRHRGSTRQEPPSSKSAARARSGRTIAAGRSVMRWPDSALNWSDSRSGCWCITAAP